MSSEWRKCAPDADIYWKPYLFEKFGTATSVAFRIGDGSWAVLSAPGNAADAGFDFFEDMGGISALVAPNIGHVSGADYWLSRKPALKFYAADSVLSGVERLVKRRPAPLSELDTGPDLSVFEAPGSRCGSVFLRNARPGQKIVYIDEAVINMEGAPRTWLNRLLFAVTGTRRGLGLNKLFLRALCDHPADHIRAIAELCQNANMVLVAHGQPLESHADISKILQMLKKKTG